MRASSGIPGVSRFGSQDGRRSEQPQASFRGGGCWSFNYRLVSAATKRRTTLRLRDKKHRKMGFIARYLLAAVCLSVGAYGMECLKQNQNGFDKIVNSCPRFWEPPEKSFCCFNLSGDDYCCDAEEFALKTGLGIIVPAIIAVVVIISLVVFCISCLCCTCCPWYRRRHRGTVYGNLQRPIGGVHVIQPSSHSGYVTQNVQNQPPVYLTTTQAMPPQYPPPPMYTQEAYSKQAPYNPGYAQQ